MHILCTNWVRWKPIDPALWTWQFGRMEGDVKECPLQRSHSCWPWVVAVGDNSDHVIDTVTSIVFFVGDCFCRASNQSQRSVVTQPAPQPRAYIVQTDRGPTRCTARELQPLQDVSTTRSGHVCRRPECLDLYYPNRLRERACCGHHRGQRPKWQANQVDHREDPCGGINRGKRHWPTPLHQQLCTNK